MLRDAKRVPQESMPTTRSISIRDPVWLMFWPRACRAAFSLQVALSADYSVAVHTSAYTIQVMLIASLAQIGKQTLTATHFFSSPTSLK